MKNIGRIICIIYWYILPIKLRIIDVCLFPGSLDLVPSCLPTQRYDGIRLITVGSVTYSVLKLKLPAQRAVKRVYMYIKKSGVGFLAES